MTFEKGQSSRCRNCGTALPESAGIPLVAFDKELDAVHGLLTFDPLAQPCPNCDTPYKAFAGFIFVHGPLRYAIVYLPAELQESSEALRTNAIPQDHFDEIDTFDQLMEAQAAIRATLLRATNEVFAPLQEAIATNTLDNWAENVEPLLQRYHYTSAFVITPYSGEQSGTLSREQLRAHMQSLLFQSVFMRVVRTVSTALDEETDPFAALDKALNPQIISDDLEERFVEILHNENVNHAVVRVVCLTLAWAAHRTGEPLSLDLSLLWCSIMIMWLTARDEDAEVLIPAINIETLRETISFETFNRMLDEIGEDPKKSDFIQAASRHQLFDLI